MLAIAVKSSEAVGIVVALLAPPSVAFTFPLFIDGDVLHRFHHAVVRPQVHAFGQRVALEPQRLDDFVEFPSLRVVDVVSDVVVQVLVEAEDTEAVALRAIPYERTSGWSSKASVGVQRRRGRGSKARCGRRDAPGKVLKDRRSPRRRGRMGTSVYS